MSFISIKYAVFLIITVLLYYIIPKKYRWVVLLGSSYVFYYLSSGTLLIYLLISTLTIYLAGLLIDRENIRVKLLGAKLEKEEKKQLKKSATKRKKLIVLCTILINFGILAVLKYSGFAGKSLNNILETMNLNKISIVTFLLPVGISYYTLMAVSYVVDVYRDKYKAEENVGKLALYLSFFPQIIEGPIARFDQTANQLYEGHKLNFDNIVHGASLILIGIFKKLVIADRAGIYVNNIFDANAQGFTLFLGAILYTIQIYAEFSGCMDIVIGSGRLFGVELPENFKRPFFSRSVQEFWRRWHITLGAWIKDYIFYPVTLSSFNGKVVNFFKKHLPKSMEKFFTVAFSLLFVWLFNGIWHGASLKYIAYGLYYYIVILFGLLLTPLLEKIRCKLKINKENIIFKLYEILRTTLIVVIGMMLFRSHSFMTFIRNFTNLFTTSNQDILSYGLQAMDFWIIAIYVIALIIIGIFQEKNVVIYDTIRKKNVLIRYALYIFIILSIVILGIYGEGYDTSSFIYGQF